METNDRRNSTAREPGRDFGTGLSDNQKTFKIWDLRVLRMRRADAGGARGMHGMRRRSMYPDYEEKTLSERLEAAFEEVMSWLFAASVVGSVIAIIQSLF